MPQEAGTIWKEIPKKFQYMKSFIENVKAKGIIVTLYHDTLCKCKHDAIDHLITDACSYCNCKTFRPIPIDEKNLKRSGNPF